MNWLSYFIGITSAWVFMGVFIFLLDFVRDRRPRPFNEVEERLVHFWTASNLIGEQKLEILRDLVTVLQKKD